MVPEDLHPGCKHCQGAIRGPCNAKAPATPSCKKILKRMQQLNQMAAGLDVKLQ